MRVANLAKRPAFKAPRPSRHTISRGAAATRRGRKPIAQPFRIAAWLAPRRLPKGGEKTLTRPKQDLP